MIFNEILRDGYNHCLFRSWTLSLDNIISLLKWYIFQGLMIRSFLSKIITTVFYFLAYEVLTTIPTLAGRKMHTLNVWFSSVQSLSRVWLCDPMSCSTPGLPVHHHLPEFTQTHIHRVGDAIKPSHPLSSPSPAPNPSQHQSLFQWVNSSHEVAKVLEFQL